MEQFLSFGFHTRHNTQETLKSLRINRAYACFIRRFQRRAHRADSTRVFISARKPWIWLAPSSSTVSDSRSVRQPSTPSGVPTTRHVSSVCLWILRRMRGALEDRPLLVGLSKTTSL